MTDDHNFVLQQRHLWTPLKFSWISINRTYLRVAPFKSPLKELTKDQSGTWEAGYLTSQMCYWWVTFHLTNFDISIQYCGKDKNCSIQKRLKQTDTVERTLDLSSGFDWNIPVFDGRKESTIKYIIYHPDLWCQNSLDSSPKTVQKSSPKHGQRPRSSAPTAKCGSIYRVSEIVYSWLSHTVVFGKKPPHRWCFLNFFRKM